MLDNLLLHELSDLEVAVNIVVGQSTVDLLILFTVVVLSGQTNDSSND